MEKITVYKKGRSMAVNAAEGALETLQADGWTDEKPKGFKEAKVPTVETLESLQAANDELTQKVADLTQQVEDLTAPPKKG